MPTWDSLFSFAFLDRLITILQTLAWPTVAAIALYAFRERVSALLEKITSAELPGGIKLDFDKEARAVEQKALGLEREEGGRKVAIDHGSDELNKLNSILSERGLRPISSNFNLQHYFNIAEIDPKLSLAAVRIDLEAVLDNLLTYYKVEVGQTTKSLSFKADVLARYGNITSAQYSIIRDVLPLANAAVHGRDPTLSSTNSLITAFGTILDDFASWVQQTLLEQ